MLFSSIKKYQWLRLLMVCGKNWLFSLSHPTQLSIAINGFLGVDQCTESYQQTASYCGKGSGSQSEVASSAQVGFAM